jgi:hypothetical protein
MADKIIAEYIVKTDKAIKNLDRLEKEVKDISKQGKKAAKDIDSNFNKTSSSLVSQFKKVGAALGVAFAATEIIAFGKESVLLAAKAEGITTAFQKLNNPNLLSELRKATRGTITDLQLMQAAVKAKNFKIPLEQLGGFFKFATNRAIETGESVDYLVDSIINGIGRKSSLVLDNLGISATELQEEMKKTGDFGAAAGNIIARELEKAGDVADTTSIKIAQLSTSFENLKVQVGDALIELGFFTVKMNESAAITSLGSEQLEDYASRAVGAAKALSELQMATGENIGVFTRYKTLLFGLSDAQEELIKKSKENNELREEEYISVERLNNLFSKIDSNQKEEIKNLKFYNDLIAELQTKQKDANITRAEVRQLEDDINDAIRERLILLGRLRRVGGEELLEQIKSIAEIELLTQIETTDDIISDKERRDDKILELQKQLNKDLSDLDEESEEERKGRQKQILLASLDAAIEVAYLISNAVIAGHNAELKSLELQLESGQITREKYDEKRRELERKKALADKNAAIFQAIISTAAGVASALPNVFLAALAGALGLAQIAVIASTPLPTFAEGGWVDQKGKIHGNSHAQGGVKIEAEGDEFIVKGKHAKKNSGLLEALNAGGGQDWINKNMVYPAIQNVLDNGDSNSNQWNNLNVQFKDHNLISAMDRDRQANVRGLSMVNNTLNKLVKNKKRGGYNA